MSEFIFLGKYRNYTLQYGNLFPPQKKKIKKVIGTFISQSSLLWRNSDEFISSNSGFISSLWVFNFQFCLFFSELLNINLQLREIKF